MYILWIANVKASCELSKPEHVGVSDAPLTCMNSLISCIADASVSETTFFF